MSKSWDGGFEVVVWDKNLKIDFWFYV